MQFLRDYDLVNKFMFYPPNPATYSTSESLVSFYFFLFIFIKIYVWFV